MIEVLSNKVLKFIDFLNAKEFTKDKVKLSILHNYEAVETDEEDSITAFAVYSVKEKTIMLPTEVRDELIDIGDADDFIIHNLAHEYKHFLQHVNNENYSEDSADAFADEMWNEFTSEYRGPGGWLNDTLQ